MPCILPDHHSAARVAGCDCITTCPAECGQAARVGACLGCSAREYRNQAATHASAAHTQALARPPCKSWVAKNSQPASSLHVGARGQGAFGQQDVHGQHWEHAGPLQSDRCKMCMTQYRGAKQRSAQARSGQARLGFSQKDGAAHAAAALQNCPPIRLPARPPAYPAYKHAPSTACLGTCLPGGLAAWLPASQRACLPASLPACVPGRAVHAISTCSCEPTCLPFCLSAFLPC